MLSYPKNQDNINYSNFIAENFICKTGNKLTLDTGLLLEFD